MFQPIMATFRPSSIIQAYYSCIVYVLIDWDLKLTIYRAAYMLPVILLLHVLYKL
jgi:hypothetical protein